MDRFSAIAPARVRVLLLPVGQIERSAFLDVVRQLQTHASVLSLKDVRRSPEEEDVLPRGSMLFNYAISDVPEQQRQLSPFELFRETLLVLGIVAGLGKDIDEQDAQLRQALDELRERHGRVVHRHLLVLDSPAGSSSDAEHVTVMQGSDQAAVVQAMAHITSDFLHDFTTYAKAMQASPSIQTPGQVSQGVLRSMMLREEEGRPKSQHSTPGEPRSPSGEESGSRPPSQDVMPPATTFDQMPVANHLGRSDSNASGRSKSRPRTTSFDRVPALSKDKLKDRGKARVAIVTGSILLMSGQWAEALKTLVEGTSRLRALNDHLWNGKGLELIVVCLLLHLWAGVDVQVPAICYQLSDKVRDRFSKALAVELAQKISGPQTPAEKLSSSLPDLLKHILLLYHSIEGTMELPYMTIAEATVRMSRTLACLHSTNGLLTEESLTHIIQQKPGSSQLKWSSSTFQTQKPLSRTGISDLLTHALPTGDEVVPLPDYISILTGVATVYSVLKMERKKAIILKALVVRLTGGLNQARKLGAAEMGIHPAASLSVDNGTEMLLDTMQGNTGLTQLAHDLVAVYGIDLGAEMPENHGSFGNRALKLQVLRDLLKLCEASPNLKGISLLVLAAMTAAGQYGPFDVTAKHRAISLSAEEQSVLVGTLSKASWLSKQLAIDPFESRYWDPFVVRGIELQPPAKEKVIYELLSSATTVDTKNPLLYDPNARRSIAKEQDVILPHAEMSRWKLTLQNPFDVTLDIEHLELATEGVPLECSHVELRLGPGRLEHIYVDVLPPTPGQTKITGCVIKIAGCVEQTFLLTKAPWKRKNEVLIKALGQDVLVQGATGEQVTPHHDIVAVKVIERQPQLVLAEVTPLRSVMLLEGERQDYSVVLENVSDVPAIITSIQCSTTSIELSDACFPGTTLIGPHQTHTQRFTLVGTTAASEARASITFAASANSNYTRVCDVILQLTVKPTVQVQRLDILAGEDDTLVFVLDLVNRWRQPLSYTCHIDAANTLEGFLSSDQSSRIQIRATRWIEFDIEFSNKAAVLQELNKRLRLSWQDVGRSGNVLLDGIELSVEAIRVLQGPPITIRVDMLDARDKPTEHSRANLGEFMTMRVKLKNRSAAAGPMFVQLRCHTPDPTATERHAALAGPLNRLVYGLPRDGDVSVDFALCPLLTGTFFVDAMIRPALPVESTAREIVSRSIRLHIEG